MKISHVARLTGASTKAIRHYEAIGLLSNIQRDGTYRVYQSKDVNLIRLIRIAQQLGFKLSEIATCIKPDETATWQDVLALIKTKRATVHEQINTLIQTRDQLDQLIHLLHACDDDEPEPVDLDDIDCELFLSRHPDKP